MVLVTGLILLMAMTLIAVGGLRGTGMQELMAGNMRDRQLAFESAESALRAAEIALEATPGGGSLASNAVDSPWSMDYWDACLAGTGIDCPTVLTHAITLADWGLVEQAHYCIERLRSGNHGSLAADTARTAPPLFRITVRALGGTADAVTILQSTYRP